MSEVAQYEMSMGFFNIIWALFVKDLSLVFKTIHPRLTSIRVEKDYKDGKVLLHHTTGFSGLELEITG